MNTTIIHYYYQVLQTETSNPNDHRIDSEPVDKNHKKLTCFSKQALKRMTKMSIMVTGLVSKISLKSRD